MQAIIHQSPSKVLNPFDIPAVNESIASAITPVTQAPAVTLALNTNAPANEVAVHLSYQLHADTPPSNQSLDTITAAPSNQAPSSSTLHSTEFVQLMAAMRDGFQRLDGRLNQMERTVYRVEHTMDGMQYDLRKMEHKAYFGESGRTCMSPVKGCNSRTSCVGIER